MCGRCVAKEAARKAGSSPHVWIKVGEVETRLSVEPPTVVAPPGEELTVGEGADEGSPFLDLFWKIYRAEKSGDAAGLALSHAEVVIPAATCSIKDPAVRAGGKKWGGNMTVWVPFLTNTAELQRGDALWCHEQ